MFYITVFENVFNFLFQEKVKNENVLESLENSFYMVYTIKNNYYKPCFIRVRFWGTA